MTVRIREEALPSVDFATGAAVDLNTEPDATRLSDHHEPDCGPAADAISLEEPIVALCEEAPRTLRRGQRLDRARRACCRRRRSAARGAEGLQGRLPRGRAGKLPTGRAASIAASPPRMTRSRSSTRDGRSSNSHGRAQAQGLSRSAGRSTRTPGARSRSSRNAPTATSRSAATGPARNCTYGGPAGARDQDPEGRHPDRTVEWRR